MEKERKIWFDPEYRKLKRHRLHFFCPMFNAQLSGCNMTCNPCLALKYRKEETTIVNVKTDDYDIYIGRGSKWGNRYRIGVDGTREEVIEKYIVDKLEDPYFMMDVVRQLQGMRLGCHCKPLNCHGDWLVEVAEGRIKYGD